MKNQIIVGVVLSVLAFLLYANTIGHDYNMDDDLVTMSHPRTSHGFADIKEIFTSYYFENTIGNQYEYRPITHLSFAIEHQFFGESALVSHLINVFLYALTAFLLFATLRSLWPQYSIVLPAVVTAFFVVHPLHTEAIASIKNREEILAFIGGISALYFGLKYVRQVKVVWLLLFVLMMVFGVLSKRSILPFIILIPVILVWFNQVKNVTLLLLALPIAIMVYLFSPNSSVLVNVLVSGFVVLAPFVAKYVIEGLDSVKELGQTLLANAKSDFAVNKFSAEPVKKWSPLALVLSLAVAAFGVWLISMDFRIGAVVVLVVLSLLALTQGTTNKLLTYLILIAYIAILGFTTGQYLVVGLPLILLAIELLKYKNAGLALSVFLVLITIPFQFFLEDDQVRFLTTAFLVGFGTMVIWMANKWPKAKWLVWFYIILAVVELVQGPTEVIRWLTMLLVAGFFLSQYVTWLHKNYQKILGVVVPAFIIVMLSTNGYFTYNKTNSLASKPPPPENYEQIDGIRQGTFVPGAGRVLAYVENPLVDEKSLSVKLGTSAGVMGYYAMLMVYPRNLNFYYGYDTVQVFSLSDVWPALLLLLLILLPIAALARARRYPILSFGVFLFVASLFAISNLGVLVAGIVAERLAYTAVLGFSIILAWILMKVLKVDFSRFNGFKAINPVFYILVIVILGAFGARTVVRNMDWKDRLTLFSTDVDMNSRSAKGLQLLGFEYLRLAMDYPQNEARYNGAAEKLFRKAIDVYPDFHSAVYNLGYLKAFQGDCNAAIPWLKRAADLEPFYPAGQFHYASCLNELGRVQEAVIHYEKCLAQDPYYEPAYANLSYAYYQLGDYDQSIQTNQNAIKRFPNSADPYINIGKALLTLNKPYDALNYFEQAYTLAPNDLNLVLTLEDLHSQIGDPQKAAFYHSRALQLGQ